MQVVDERTKNNVKFSDLKIGDVFRYDEYFYLKIETVRSGKIAYNCVWLSDGVRTSSLSYFDGTVEVNLVKCKLVIE